jgi:hypothetical protein
MTETSIPRQHIQKRFHYNGYVKVVQTPTKDIRKVGILEDGDLYTVQPKPTSGRYRMQNT